MPRPDRYTVETIMGNRVRYEVPSFYQRAYVWTLEKQWTDLWADIRRKTDELLCAKAASSDPSVQQRIANHFMGAFVVNAVPAYGFNPPRKDVIDGQQRLTTLQILLNTFRHVAAQLFGAGDQIVSQLQALTHNTNASGEYEYKILPTEADRGLFQKIMSAGSRDEVFKRLGMEPPKPNGQQKPKPTGMDGAYCFLDEEILSFLTRDDSGATLAAEISRARALALYEVIVQRMDLVMIELDEKDDPQVIFEALNGRGTPLLPSDLIKNYVFDRLRPVCPGRDPMLLYQEHWSEFDKLEDETEEDDHGEPQKFWKIEVRQGRLYRPRIDLFLFHYLQYKRGQEVAISELFREFKTWWSQQPTGDLAAVKASLDDIRRHARIFRSFLIASSGSETADRLWHLRAIDTSTIYPVLLFLFFEAQVNPNRVAVTSLPQLLADLESFLVRRTVCGLTSKNYNNIFMKLLADLRRLDVVDPHAVGRLLSAGDDPTNRCPRDDEFHSVWLSRPIYAPSVSGFINMMLAAINERMRTDAQEPGTFEYENLWVEHIMPRKWQAKWQLPNADAEHHKDPVSGVIVTNRQWRDTLIHTMGNLTLLTAKLNDRISNGPFVDPNEKTDKKREFEKHTRLRVNDSIKKRESWDEAAILERAESLFEHAVAIWPYPAAT
ncbi:DUF262 domain-containing protein [bacterium]|nr:MAG: DUF262 domain-containing protein [bacterium]